MALVLYMWIYFCIRHNVWKRIISCCLTFVVFMQLTEWWMQSAYLDCRMPVAVYTSPGVVLPRMHFTDRQGQMR